MYAAGDCGEEIEGVAVSARSPPIPVISQESSCYYCVKWCWYRGRFNAKPFSTAASCISSAAHHSGRQPQESDSFAAAAEASPTETLAEHCRES